MEIKKNILHYYINLMRGRSDCVTPLHNVLNTMKLSRHSCIFAENFSKLYLGNIPLNKIFFSDDGKYPTTFEGSTIGELNLISDFKSDITNLAYSNDGKSIVASSYRDNSAAIIDIETGIVKNKFPANDGVIVISADGKKCMTESEKGDVYVLDTETNKIIHTLIKKKKRLTPIGFSESGKVIITCSKYRSGNARNRFSNAIQLWSAETGKFIKEIKLSINTIVSIMSFNTVGIEAVKMSPDNKKCVIFMSNGIYFIMNAENGNITTKNNYAHEEECIESISLSAYARTCLIQLLSDRVLYLINTETGEKIEYEFENITSSAISYDGKMCIIGIKNEPFILIDTETGQKISKFARDMSCIDTFGGISISFPSENNTDKCIISIYNQIFLYNINTGQIIKRYGGHTDHIMTMLIPQNDRLLTASIKGYICCWDVEKGVLLNKFQGYKGTITSMVFLQKHDGAVLVGYSDGTIVLYDGKGQQMYMYEEKIFNDSIESMAVSPDECHFLASEGNGIKTVLFDLNKDSFEIRHEFDEKSSGYAVAISDDGKMFIGEHLDLDEHIAPTVYDITTLEPIYEVKHELLRTIKLKNIFKLHSLKSDEIVSATFSLDNKYLLTCSQHDNSCILWNAENGDRCCELKSHNKSGFESKIKFSVDNKTVFTANKYSKIAIIHRISNGKVLKKLKLNERNAVISDDFTIMAGSNDYTAVIFTPEGKQTHELYNITDLHIKDCNFSNIKASEKTKEILRQQQGKAIEKIPCRYDPIKVNSEEYMQQQKEYEQKYDGINEKENFFRNMLKIQLFELLFCIVILIYTIFTGSWHMLWYAIPGILFSGYCAMLSIEFSFNKKNIILFSDDDKKSTAIWGIIFIIVVGILLICFIKDLTGINIITDLPDLIDKVGSFIYKKFLISLCD